MSYEIIAAVWLLYIIISCCGLLYWILLGEKQRQHIECSSPKVELAKKEQRKTTQKFVPDIIIQIVTIIAVGYAIYYLIWRVSSTLNQDALWLSWMLLAAEIYGLLIFLLFAFLTWKLINPIPPKPRDGIAVDIFITTYGEPIDILRATLVACSQIHYPHQTYMLDDTGRDEVRGLAVSHSCIYITRSDRKGAKAGAINHALKQSKGELIAVLDADHIPLPSFLDETIGFFDDPEVAIVQGPQLFYNLDSFEHTHSPWHEQRMFFHVIQPGKNRTKSAFWAGTPSVLRRAAIEAIGGVAEESVTEDLHTSIRLIRGGYRVLYIDRPLAVGLAPATVEDFLGQRFRWAQGAMQIFRLDNPLTSRGFTLSQRISFFASMQTYFDALQKLVLFLVPLIVLITGILPMNTFEWPFWIRFIPYIILMFLGNWLLGRGTYHIWGILHYDTVKMFTFISSLRTLLTGHARPFRVTSKVAGGKTRSLFQRIITPHWVFIALMVCGIAIGITHLIHPVWYEQKPIPLLIATVWGMFDLILLISVVWRLTGVSRRVRHRFPSQTSLLWQLISEAEWHQTRSVDLSATGLGFRNNGQKLHLGDRLKVIIPWSGKRDINLTSIVVGECSDDYGNQRIGLLIQELASESDADRYSQIVYSPSGLLWGEDVNAPYLERSTYQPWRRFLEKIPFIRSQGSRVRMPVIPVPPTMPIPGDRRI